ncbi:hypothetical protein DPMN_142320 [Dreissena polymorpha]|uniref:NACHT domain-containing protein n=2 Tax=Dreissena polymorpha TaxID=45954 RepID=A0A9D4GB32_DREPO|nr:hypothetical protein DPMN_142320 [Dreissena polymorpha]
MSLKELGELLKEVYQTLDRAKEAGERVSKEAEINLLEALQTLEFSTLAGKRRLESQTQLGEHRIEIKTLALQKHIETKKQDAVHCLESKIKDGTQRIERHVRDGLMRFQQAETKTASKDYERGLADLRQRLMKHYVDTTCNVPLSTFDQSLDKRITDIYETPNIHRIIIEKDGKRLKKEEHVLTYKDILYTNDKSNKRIYIQGEPGRGKSTFAVKLVHDWCNDYQPSSAAPIEKSAFGDGLTLQKFKLLFFISLRDSRGQTDVTQMIKKQLIDKMFSEDERADVYKLFVKIMKTEICLVVREGLDEWTPPDGSNVAEPSMAGFQKDTCTILTTSRPWKLADERIKNSQIDSLLEIEGITCPYAFSKNILRCLICETTKLNTAVNEFQLFVQDRKLESLSSSPMLYALVICTWVDKIGVEEYLKGSSLCALYTTLLECLCKKANIAIGYFNDSNAPPVQCFYSTSYIQPNIEHLDRLAYAAFKLLFSFERESSIVFNDKILSNYFSHEAFSDSKLFSLKAGILTNRKDKSRTGCSNSFVHITLQEFLAAYHIACNPNVVDEISTFLSLNKESYLEISQVLIFLCGMNISVANKLSALMYKCDMDYFEVDGQSDFFQTTIESGIREAVANKQDGICLKLDYCCIEIRKITDKNTRDLQLVYSTITSNVERLSVVSSSVFSIPNDIPARNKLKSSVEVNLSACHKLTSLELVGKDIWLGDTASSTKAKHPVLIVLNRADEVQCADPRPVLPSLKRIDLHDVTCSSTWLHSLFSTLLTCDHKVVCELEDCYINSCAESVSSKIQTGKHKMHISMYDSPGLREALRGLNIMSLTLSGAKGRLEVKCVESFKQLLSSLKQLDSLSIYLYESPGLWDAVSCLNIKSLTLRGFNGRLNVKCVESFKQSLSSFKQLDLLSINVYDISEKWKYRTLSETLSIDMSNSPRLWNALDGLNIKSLIMNGWNGQLDVTFLESFKQTLSSLKHLETINIDMNASPGLLEAVKGLNIKSLNLTGCNKLLDVKFVESFKQTLSSLKLMDSLRIDMYASPVLLEALNGLNIKSLTLRFWNYNILKVIHVQSVSHTTSSLKQLETLTICVRNYIEIQLPQSLKYVNIYCCALYPSDLRKLVETLSACAQKIEGKLEFGCSTYNRGFFCTRIPVEEYMAIRQELEALKNVSVKRFQIFERIRPNMQTGSAVSSWSVSGICDADDDHGDFGNVHEDTYRQFIEPHILIIHRISMRFVISPASISKIREYDCMTRL